MSNLFIGFTNKFYTLWQRTEEDRYDYGTRYHVVRFDYIKNISFDKEKAIAAYPEATVDLELRGRTSFEKVERIEDGTLFQFGKYKGEKIAECADYSYMFWYFNNGCSPENRAEIEKILLPLGYEYLVFNNGSKELITPKDAAERRVFEKEKAIKTAKFNGSSVEMLFEKNLDESGCYYAGHDVYIQFTNFVQRDYQGWLYGLPTINSKAKRIKNKIVKLLEYTVEKNNTIIINVTKFEIIK